MVNQYQSININSIIKGEQQTHNSNIIYLDLYENVRYILLRVTTWIKSICVYINLVDVFIYEQYW